MSISAIIESVTLLEPTQCVICGMRGKDPADSWDDCPVCRGATKESPLVILRLVARDPGGVPGQSQLAIVDPPELSPDEWRGLVGVEIWGSSDCIMIGTTKWADRISTTRIRLVDKVSVEPKG